MTAEGSAATAEIAQPRELLGKGSVKKQAQLLGVVNASGKVDPEKVDTIAKQGALGIDQEQQKQHADKSVQERKQYQEEHKLTLDTWTQRTDAWINKQRTDSANPAKAEFMNKIFGENIDAKTFYAKYLGTKSNVIAFINDVETNASREQIIQHAEIIRDLGKIFGSETSEAIEHMIHGVHNIKADKDAFIEAVGPIEEAIPAPGEAAKDKTITPKPVVPPASAKEPEPDPKPKPEPKPEQDPKPEVQLTPELAESDPGKFKSELIRALSRYPYAKKAWELALQQNITSLDKLTLNPSEFMGHSGEEGSITIGTQHLPPDLKEQIVFNPDQNKPSSYTDEIVHKFIHELTHQLNVYEFGQGESDEDLNNLFRSIIQLRKSSSKGFSSLGSLDHYKDKAGDPDKTAEKKAYEDLAELATMYLVDPQYLKTFLHFLADPQHQQTRDRLKLVTISEDSIAKTFAVVEKAINAKLILQPEPEPEPEPKPEQDPKPQEVLTPEQTKQIAEKLLNYDTGEVTDETVDLGPSFLNLVDRVEGLLRKESLPKDKPVIIISDVARAMIEKIAETGNTRHVELGFGLHGFRVERSPDVLGGMTDHVDIIGLVAPASNWTNAQAAHVMPDFENVHQPSLEKLLTNTNLQNLPTIQKQKPLILAHLHPAYLGDQFAGKFSSQDIEGTERIFTTYPQAKVLGVIPAAITKTADGRLLIDIRRWYRDTDGSIKNEPITVLFEQDLPKPEPKPEPQQT